MVRFLYERALGHTSDWLRDESGNTTVDWVVIVAGLVALSIAVMTSISGGVELLADKTGTELSTRELSTY